MQIRLPHDNPDQEHPDGFVLFGLIRWGIAHGRMAENDTERTAVGFIHQCVIGATYPFIGPYYLQVQ